MSVRISAIVASSILSTVGFYGSLAQAAQTTPGTLSPARAAAEPVPPTPRPPSCMVTTYASSWTVPVNAPGIPMDVWETDGGRLTPAITTKPVAETTFLADATAGRPEVHRILRIANAQAGTTYDVSVGGTCTATSTLQPVGPTAQNMTVTFTSEAPFPTSVGSLTEGPEGLIVLTLDPSMRPYEQLAQIRFTLNGSGSSEYGMGRPISPTAVYGVQACVNGACRALDESGIRSDWQPKPRIPNNLCPKRRESGKVAVNVTAEASFRGTTDRPAVATGILHIDCSKATDAELGPVYTPSSSSSQDGCSVSGVGKTNRERSGVAVAGFALAFVVMRRRRARYGIHCVARSPRSEQQSARWR